MELIKLVFYGFMILLQMLLFVGSSFVPFVEIVFVSSNTESSFTHEAGVTVSSIVAGVQVCQRLGVEAVEGAGPIPGASPRCPGQTLCATLTLFCAIVP